MTTGQDIEELVRFVLAPGTSDDPFAHYLRLRELADVHRSERTGMTLLSRYADCRQVLGDPETFRVVDTDWMAAHRPGWRPSPSQEQFLSSLFFRNPPDHTRLRRQLSRGFTARRLRVLRPLVHQEVLRALDRLAAVPPGEAADFQELVAVPLSLTVLGGLLGIPASDHPRCWTLLHEAVPAPDPAADEAARAALARRADEAAAELAAYFTDLIARKRTEPGDDLVSACLREQADDPEQLTDHELALAVLPVFGAGVTTLSDTLGNIMHTLLAHPGRLERLAADPAQAERAAAEAFRYCGGYHITRRYATRDTEIRGVPVEAGSVLVLLLAGANRDPEAFGRPEEFDVERPETASLAFGAGIHHCLGAALAKLLVETVCGALHRAPALRPAGPPRWRPSLLFFGPVHLPVTVVAEPPTARPAP
ncbi:MULTISPECIES: cytochrome P450 [Streptomyces]|uniref:Cytochrome P450 n=1 Tax=Streptomyces tricolor TaxID=68277 RepID=A0ABS9J8R7_9ACTN|nr:MULTISPECIES: cytochrome P450 [Streptomyces]MCG0061957.1 cytochrome P450 [Streptomyces tricolor]BCM64928.1 putative cytochrome P450 [Streptomyces sp. EAS-AB2608]CUW32836.1 Cytochrome P450 107B1 [Streptomyces reticuli]